MEHPALHITLPALLQRWKITRELDIIPHFKNGLQPYRDSEQYQQEPVPCPPYCHALHREMGRRVWDNTVWIFMRLGKDEVKGDGWKYFHGLQWPKTAREPKKALELQVQSLKPIVLDPVSAHEQEHGCEIDKCHDILVIRILHTEGDPKIQTEGDPKFQTEEDPKQVWYIPSEHEQVKPTAFQQMIRNSLPQCRDKNSCPPESAPYGHVYVVCLVNREKSSKRIEEIAQQGNPDNSWSYFCLPDRNQFADPDWAEFIFPKGDPWKALRDLLQGCYFLLKDVREYERVQGIVIINDVIVTDDQENHLTPKGQPAAPPLADVLFYEQDHYGVSEPENKTVVQVIPEVMVPQQNDSPLVVNQKSYPLNQTEFYAVLAIYYAEGEIRTAQQLADLLNEKRAITATDSTIQKGVISLKKRYPNLDIIGRGQNGRRYIAKGKWTMKTE